MAINFASSQNWEFHNFKLMKLEFHEHILIRHINGTSSIWNESADRPGGPEYDFGNDRRRRGENFVQKY